MFLRSLSLRGFKSFADATLLEVEPGITVVVGPNGSGKSNLVDALSWVLGTHSAKKVRGSTMTDVIFDGSKGRARANRARVEIAIDNSDGRLAGSGVGTSASAAGFTEVRIARTIHSDGETSYEINGEEVRAVDVQELLSDTGLGRELHTIVGQGQLDEILNAKPEERRRYIEEAAGILKHRRRRERAVRKLEAVEEHSEKLRAIVRELRRQLRPLERQAQAADRHAALQADLRDTRVRIAALEIADLDRLVAEVGRSGDEKQSSEQEAEARVAALKAAERELERELDEAASGSDAASVTYYGLVSLAERARGTADLVEAKMRHLAEVVVEPLPGRPPTEFRAQADTLERDLVGLTAELAAREEAFATATAARAGAEAARQAHEALAAERRRARIVAGERRVRWEGEVAALKGLVATRAGELERAEGRIAELDARAGELDTSMAAIEDEIQRIDASEGDLLRDTEVAEARVTVARQRLDDLVRQRREVESERAAQIARAEALTTALAGSTAGARALMDSTLEGVLGAVAEHVEIDQRFEAAIAAALGPLGAAVVVTSPDQARRAIAWLRGAKAGSALVLAARPDGGATPRRGALDEDTVARLASAQARPVIDLLRPAPSSPVGAEVVAALTRVLATSHLVRDWDTAVLLHGRDPDLTFVTPEGDVASPAGYRSGAVGGDASVATRVAAVAAETRAATLEEDLVRLNGAIAEVEATLASHEADLAAATERLNESDAALTGAAERLARLGRERTSIGDQRGVLVAQRDEAAEASAREQERLVELEGSGPETPSEDGDADVGETELAALEVALHVTREAEFEARIARERAADEVARAEATVASLRAEADSVEDALAEADRRRTARREGIVRCGHLAELARAAVAAGERAIVAAEAERERVGAAGAHLRTQLTAARERAAEAATDLERVREERHATDLRRAEATSRLEALAARIRAELALGPDDVRAEVADVTALDPAALTEREDVLVRRIALLGRVNPLALEEFRALEERHRFLSDQLDDLRRSKRDLEEIVVAVDERIRTIFKQAFDDVAREFEVTFATVFPGGKGRLVLTGEEDLLTAGVDVEARPPGKRVKRLSLLSGGERSLTVLAFVFAIFRARPSPFYVLDEVDAALDDVNLQRLLRIVRSFRGHAQIIMVTHQKRSMEIADLLYGVTMGPDAVTKVVAERLRDGAAVVAIDERASDEPTAALLEPDQPAAV